jgi:hypothetical protein
MKCPNSLVFNKYLDRCDYDDKPPNQGCHSNPCQYGGTCFDLGNWVHECDCPEGYSGKNCEITPNYCELNLCGDNGFCFPMPPQSPIPYYCVCGKDEGYGRNCDRGFERNPCTSDQTVELSFPTKLSSSVYVQCDEETFHLRFCKKPLVFSKETNKCEWIVPSV